MKYGGKGGAEGKRKKRSGNGWDMGYNGFVERYTP